MMQAGKTLLVMTNHYMQQARATSFQTVATLNNSLLLYITPNFSVSATSTMLAFMNLFDHDI